ncbi:MAG: hypothetical protein JRH07_18805, partial [Deltaproteobacteria bacterium]|nr:hypothetical protein [Deltaproteobacteria bacterium]
MNLKRATLILVLALVSVLVMEGLGFSAEKITLTLWTRKQTSKYLTDLRVWGI